MSDLKKGWNLRSGGDNLVSWVAKYQEGEEKTGRDRQGAGPGVGELQTWGSPMMRENG